MYRDYDLHGLERAFQRDTSNRFALAALTRAYMKAGRSRFAYFMHIEFGAPCWHEEWLRELGQFLTSQQGDVLDQDLGETLFAVEKHSNHDLWDWQTLDQIREYQRPVLAIKLVGAVCDTLLENIAAFGCLREFYSDRVSLSDHHIKLLAEASELRSLGITRGEFSANALSPLSSLSHLRFIRLPRKLMDEHLISLSKLPSLECLELNNRVGLTDKGLVYLSRFPALKYIDLRDVEVGLTSLESLAGSSIEELRLCRSDIDDEGLRQLSRISTLRSLELWDCCGFSDKGLSFLAGSSIRRLKLTSSSGVDDQGLEALSALKTLEVLDVYHCLKVTDRGVEALSKLPLLRELDLTLCKAVKGHAFGAWKNSRITHLKLRALEDLTDEALIQVSALKALRFLDVSSCKSISNHGFRALASLDKLEELQFTQCCQISDQGLDPLLSLPALKTLRVETHSLGDDMKARLKMQSSLTTLIFFHTSFRGTTVSGSCSTLRDSEDAWSKRLKRRPFDYPHIPWSL